VTSADDVRRISGQLWPGTSVALEELTGGITNVNYKASTPDGTYVIRLFGSEGELLAIDRETEQAATVMAAGLGIGPELVLSEPLDGYLVTRFLPGQQVAPGQMRAPGMLARVAETLRTLHRGPAIPGTIDPLAVTDFYRANAVARGADPGADYGWARPIASRIERAVGFAMTAPCHGDLLTANFIDHAGRLYLVDWEYAGMSDPRFDLANFSVNHGFGIDEDRRLVRLYCGRDDEQAVAAVRLLRFMSAFREAMWSVLQHAISDLDFDFLEYAGVQFTRMRQAEAGDEFRAALALLEPAGDRT
jgi:aminoglycoside phosphotransferase (APT) family kinase protein